MKNKSFVFFFLLISLFAFSQKSKIDFSNIKKEIKNPESAYSYNKMVYRYKGMPKTLDSIEAMHLYYGRNYIDNKVSTSDQEFKLMLDDLRKNDFDTTIEKAKQLLHKDPTNLDLLMVLLQCYDKQKDVRNFSHYLGQFHLLTRAILDSGDGKSEKTPYIVNSVGDEYILLNVIRIPMDATRSSKATKGGMFDIWENNREKTYIKVIYDDY